MTLILIVTVAFNSNLPRSHSPAHPWSSRCGIPPGLRQGVAPARRALRRCGAIPLQFNPSRYHLWSPARPTCRPGSLKTASFTTCGPSPPSTVLAEITGDSLGPSTCSTMHRAEYVKLLRGTAGLDLLFRRPIVLSSRSGIGHGRPANTTVAVVQREANTFLRNHEWTLE